jgi:maltose O-acetyltransferase
MTTASPGEIRSAGWAQGGKLLIIRVLNYVTNYVVANIPSYTVRHWWYRQVLGVQLGESSGILLGCYLWFYGPGQMRRNGLRIGKCTRINRGCTLDCRGSLSIGDYVNISPGVTILTSDHDYNDPAFPGRDRGVVIGDHVWIGTRAMIMGGVTVGRGAVISAGAVVGTDVAPGTVMMGVPARPVGRREAEPEEVYIRLPLFE